MPELPEVETIRRQIGPLIAERTVAEAWAFDSAKFTPARDVGGARLGPPGRRGKYLLFPTDDGRELVVHLGMTGSLYLADGPEAPTGPHVRAWWRLDRRSTLVFNDIRRFGRLRVVEAGRYDDIPTLAAMGPEPFDPELDGARFWALLRRSRRAVKTNLLSQRPIAGIGNIYADEALWLAGIDPRARRLGRARSERLLQSLQIVLEQAIDNGGTTLRDYRDVSGGTGRNQRHLQVYGRQGSPCPRCETELMATVIDARTTTWCGRCQRP